jgi:hypothetical protein
MRTHRRRGSPARRCQSDRGARGARRSRSVRRPVNFDDGEPGALGELFDQGRRVVDGHDVITGSLGDDNAAVRVCSSGSTTRTTPRGSISAPLSGSRLPRSGFVDTETLP